MDVDAAGEGRENIHFGASDCLAIGFWFQSCMSLVFGSVLVVVGWR